MENLFVLPTDKPSRLVKNGSNVLLLTIQTLPLDVELGCFPHNIYITSDEEIKEGDWCIEYDDIDKKWLSPYKPNNEFWDMVGKANYCRIRGTVKKIILTTDPQLIADGVQAIDDEFLEWFVKNPSCESVGIEKECCGQCDERLCEIKDLQREETIYNTFYKITIPKEPKQETLEEVKDLLYWKANAEEDYMKVPISVLRYISELEEKSYSDEEVDKLISLLKQTTEYEVLQSFRDKVEQFKKK